MKTPILSKLDTAGRLLLPSALRNPLDWQSGDKLYATLSQDGKTVTLQKPQQTPNTANIEICDLGRITLPKTLRKEMCWDVGSTINLVHNAENSTITLVYVSSGRKACCVLCDSPEEIVIINDKGVCKTCAKIVAQAL